MKKTQILKKKKKSARKRRKKKIEEAKNNKKKETQSNDEIRETYRTIRDKFRTFHEDEIHEIDFRVSTYNLGTIPNDLKYYIEKNRTTKKKNRKIQGMKLIVGDKRRQKNGGRIRQLIKDTLKELRKEEKIIGFQLELSIKQGCYIVVLNKEEEEEVEEEEEKEEEEQEKERDMSSQQENKTTNIYPKEERKRKKNDFKQRMGLQKEIIKKKKKNKKRKERRKRKKKKKQSTVQSQQKKDFLDDGDHEDDEPLTLEKMLSESYDTTENIDDVLDLINSI